MKKATKLSVLPQESVGQQPPNEHELHYKSLLAYFNSLVEQSVKVAGWLLVAMGLLFSAAGFLFWKNLGDARVAASREVAKRVGEEFEAQKIKILIEQLILSNVQAQIESSVSNQVSPMVRGVEAIMNAKQRWRVGLDELEAMRGSTNAQEREVGRRNFARLCAIYEDIVQGYTNSWGTTNVVAALVRNVAPGGIDTGQSSNTNLLHMMRFQRNLELVAVSIACLRQKTGQTFRMFDFDAVEAWFSARPKSLAE